MEGNLSLNDNLDISPEVGFAQNMASHIHSRLLRDVVRTSSFQKALQKAVQPGMVVLDLGTGTGVLSMFAARAGARRVYAVDHNPDIFPLAKKLARANGLANKITFIPGDSRVLKLPEKVDLIVSECIGAMVYNGQMISALTDARDRLLKPGGRVVPQKLTLYAAPIESPPHYEYANYLQLDRRYGIDFSSVETSNGVYHTRLPPEGVLATPVVVDEADLVSGHPNEMLDADLEFVIDRPCQLHGFGFWFKAHLWDDVAFDSSPNDPLTIWKHQFVGCGQEIALGKGARVRLQLKMNLILLSSGHVVQPLSWRVQTQGDSGPIDRSFSTKRTYATFPKYPEFTAKIDGVLLNQIRTAQTIDARKTKKPVSVTAIAAPATRTTKRKPRKKR